MRANAGTPKIKYKLNINIAYLENINEVKS